MKKKDERKTKGWNNVRKIKMNNELKKKLYVNERNEAKRKVEIIKGRIKKKN